MIIAHNMMAMNANRIIGINNKSLQKSTTKLSSGYRINVAADDAAGLTISEKMRSQIRGLKRASDNAQDGISLIQTADGAAGQLHGLVHRIRELAVQAANDVNATEDRAAIQNEIDELIKQVDYVSETTEFNQKKLMDGSCASTSTSPLPIYKITTFDSIENPLQTFSLEALNGEKAGEIVSLREALEADGLTIIYEEITDDFTTTQTPGTESTASGYNTLKSVLQQEIVPQAVKSILNTFSDTFGYLNGSSIGIGLKLENNPSSTALASVGISFGVYADDTVVSNQFSYQLTVNMAYLNLDSTGAFTDGDPSGGRSALETTIVHEMMHALMDETLTNGMIGVSDGKHDPSNQFPGWFKEGMAQTAAGGCSPYNDWVNGGLGLTDDSSIQDIVDRLTDSSYSLSSGSTASEYGTGYLACMYLGYLANGSSSVSASSIASGLDKIMNEIKNGKSMDEVIKELTPYSGGLSDFESSFGDDASAQFTQQLLGAVGDDGNGGLVSGNYQSTDLLPDTTYSTNLFQLNTTKTSVTNTYPDDVEKLNSGGSTVNANNSGGSGSTGGTGGTSGSGGSGGTGGTGGSGGSGGTGGTGGSGSPSGAGGLTLQVGANEGQTLQIYIDKMDSVTLGINQASVDNHTKAGNTITAADKALNKISVLRSTLGAYQNRLEYSIDNSDNSAENLQAAESRIRDLDMASEMVSFNKNQILLQASQAMLTQASQQPESVLQLLR